MKKLISLSVFLVIFFTAFYVIAMDDTCGIGTTKSMGSSASQGKIVNTTCPVMGGEVTQDTPYYTMYDDKKIGFCCEGCLKAFEADPQKYAGNIK